VGGAINAKQNAIWYFLSIINNNHTE